jgi:hypothetical protein
MTSSSKDFILIQLPAEPYLLVNCICCYAEAEVLQCSTCVTSKEALKVQLSLSHKTLVSLKKGTWDSRHHVTLRCFRFQKP